MNYSKSYRRTAVARRVLILCGVTAVISLLIGCAVGYALKGHISPKQTTKEKEQGFEQGEDKYCVFGAFDDRKMNDEISLDWGAGDLDFTPLNCGMPEEHQEFLFYLCNGYNIDFTFTMALIQAESDFDPDAISRTNDWGYMQINKINHEWLTETIGVTDYLDPYQNMRAGCFILRQLFQKYQDADFVLMAYKMGENGATRLWEKGVFSTDYTERVLNYQEKFIEQLGGENE